MKGASDFDFNQENFNYCYGEGITGHATSFTAEALQFNDGIDFTFALTTKSENVVLLKLSTTGECFLVVKQNLRSQNIEFNNALYHT